LEQNFRVRRKNSALEKKFLAETKISGFMAKISGMDTKFRVGTKLQG